MKTFLILTYTLKAMTGLKYMQNILKMNILEKKIPMLKFQYYSTSTVIQLLVETG